MLRVLTHATVVAVTLIAIVFTVPDAPSRPERQGKPEWQAVARSALARAEYDVTRTPTGFQAPNRAQGFRTHFRETGIQVVPRTSDASGWFWGWTTTAWGRNGNALGAAAVAPTLAGSRIEYARAGLVEWYENRVGGLEQGFTVTARPEGEGPLWIEGCLAQDLEAEIDDSGAVVDFHDEGGTQVLRYAGLVVRDAQDRALDAHFALENGAVRIVVDDAAASYPIVVDPTLTTPQWSMIGDQGNAGFGAVAATAGDVNGDGYSDMIVTSPRYDTGFVDAGRAWLFLGGPSGLALAPAWVADGDQDSSRFGESAATAGDVNGDGYEDVIVGASGHDGALVNEGRAYVYLGSASGLSFTPEWTVDGGQEGAECGALVSSAGDVNRDGYDDVIVGAHYYDNQLIDAGRAAVYLGSPAGLAITPAWTREGNQPGSRLGQAAARADVNSDGYDDVIIGAPFNLFDPPHAGGAFVYMGSASGLDTTATEIVPAQVDGNHLGLWVSSAGDVNGDGYEDVVIVGYENSNANAYVFLGSASGLSTLPAWSKPAGYLSAATAGDFNGDGYGDLISAGGGNDADVYFGSPSGLSTAVDWELDVNFLADGMVGTAGDVNGDGLSDIIASAAQYPFPGDNTNDPGKVILFYGRPSLPSTSVAWSVEANQSAAAMGQVANAGDVNGDGYSDLLVGVPQFDNGETNEGRSLLYLGSASGFSLTPAWTNESNQAQAQFGNAVSTAGDVNGDGYDDVLVAATFYDNPQPNEGRAYLYLGSATGLSTSQSWTMETDSTAALVSSVSAAGDVNGDGYGDVIVGSQGYGGTGKAYLYLGSSSGLALSPAWTARGVGVTLFGRKVSGAVDVNGDGYSDVIVTAQRAAYVYLGSASGLGANAAWSQSTATGNFGVAAAFGDFNGDGYSDVVVGDDQYTNGQTSEGRASVFLGSASGPSPSADWTAESNNANYFFGGAVSSTDLDGDGYSDVLVGVRGSGLGFVGAGSVSVFPGSSTGPASLGLLLNINGGQLSAGLGTSVAGIDSNGDGFGDIVGAATGYDNPESNEGRVVLYYGNGRDGRERAPQQWNASSDAPIGPLGNSGSNTSYRIKMQGFSPEGRGKVRIQAEVKPRLVPFDGLGTALGPWTETSTTVPLMAQVSALTQNTEYHWRARIVTDSEYFPHGPWVSPPFNSASEWDFRALGEGSSDLVGTVSGPKSVASEEKATVSFTVTASDPDGDPFGSFTANLAGLPAGHDAMFVPSPNNSSGLFTWHPAQGMAGTYSVMFTASNALSATHTTSIRVAPLGATDTGTLAWTPAAQDEGTYNVTFTAHDENGNTATATTTVTVSAAQAPAPIPMHANAARTSAASSPTMSAPTAVTGTVGSTLAFSVSAAQADSISCDISGLPAGNDASFVVDHEPVPSAPAFRTTDPGVTLTFTVTASDADGDGIGALVADLSGLPAGNNATFAVNGTQTSGLFTWTPGMVDSSDYIVWFKASNSLARYAPTVISVGKGLARYWKFNGDATDAAKGEVLTPSGGVSYTTGQLQAAADLDGSTSGRLAGAASPQFDLTASGLTFETWVQVRSLGFGVDPRIAFAGHDQTPEYWEVLVCDEGCGSGNAKVRVVDGGTVVEIQSNATVANGAWHHLAFTYDGTNLKLYVDGNLDKSMAQPGLAVTAGGGSFLIGDTPSGGNQFDGRMDEMRLWTRARSAAAILTDMNRERGYPTSVETQAPRLVDHLAQNRPNPFNPSTRIEFELAQAGRARLEVFDVLGRHVASLVDRVLPAGSHQVAWSGRDDRGRSVASGVYFYRLTSGRFADTKRMVLLE